MCIYERRLAVVQEICRISPSGSGRIRAVWPPPRSPIELSGRLLAPKYNASRQSIT